MKQIKKYFNLVVLPIEKKGLGVFTEEFIPKNSLIEIAPVLEIEDDIVNYSGHKKHTINEHLYKIDKNKNYFIVFGYGSLYNHNDNENIFAEYNEDLGCYFFHSKKDINKGEELCLNYGYKRDGWI